MSLLEHMTDKVSEKKSETANNESASSINHAEMLHEQYKVFQRNLNPDLTGDDPVQRLVKEEEEKTIQGKGLAINDNPALEHEADVLGKQAAEGKDSSTQNTNPADSQVVESSTIQRLEQPITETAPANAIGMEEFIDLVIQEEQKYPEEEQTNTSLMITRLRKIFYGSEGWDEHLITGVEDIESPYGEPRERERSRQRVEVGLGFLTDFDVVDTETYPVDPATGERPEIYQNQEIRMPDGNYIDMGHIFAGLDAFNHRHQVTAIGDIAIDNVEGTTWVGDLGSVLAEVKFEDLRTDGPMDESTVQNLISEYASPQDMLGNIDAYAIQAFYNTGESEMKVSDILRDYYLGERAQARQGGRYRIFAAGIGLQNWDGSGWSNEDERVEHYMDQVNDAAAMYLYVGADTINYASLGGGVLGLAGNEWSRVLVQLFFDALREKVCAETATP